MARNQRCFRTPPREEGDSPAVPDFLLLLPKLVWPAEAGTNEKNVQCRLAWAHQGRWADRVMEALARPATLQPANQQMPSRKVGSALKRPDVSTGSSSGHHRHKPSRNRSGSVLKRSCGRTATHSQGHHPMRTHRPRLWERMVKRRRC